MDFEIIREDVSEFRNSREAEVDIYTDEESQSLEVLNGRIRISSSEIKDVRPVSISSKYRIDAILIELTNGSLLFREDNSFLFVVDPEFEYKKDEAPVIDIGLGE